MRDPATHLKPGHRPCWPVNGKTTGQDDKGQGKILCGICGTPVAEHPIGPCPNWDRNQLGPITLPALSTRTHYRRKQQ